MEKKKSPGLKSLAQTIGIESNCPAEAKDGALRSWARVGH